MNGTKRLNHLFAMLLALLALGACGGGGGGGGSSNDGGSIGPQLAVGGYHTCARLHTGLVKCWGDNFFGQLGLADTNSRGDGANEMGDQLPAVALGSGRTAVQLAVGDAYTCALLDNSEIKCWG